MIGNIIIGFVATFFMMIILPKTIANGAYGDFIFIGLLFCTTVLTYFIFPENKEPIESPTLESNGMLTKITNPDGTVEVHVPKRYNGTQQDIEDFANGIRK